MIPSLYPHSGPARAAMLLLIWMLVAPLSPAVAQNSGHPDAKPPLPANPYLQYTDPWRWDIRTQLFLSAGHVVGYHPGGLGEGVFDSVHSIDWELGNIELVFPVVREGSFFWSPNEDVEVDVRLDDVNAHNIYHRRGGPVDIDDLPVERKFVKGTYDAYTYWRAEGISGRYRQLHLIHNSHIVTADTRFNENLARRLPWPDEWVPRAASYLRTIVDSTGEPVPEDAHETIRTLLDFWIDGNDPTDISQLDLVKFLTGKVIEHITVRGPSTEFPVRSSGGGRQALAITTNAYGGFIVRPAHEIAREPSGSKHDLAVLLTAVLRSAGVPARTVICVDKEIEDPLLNIVSLVEFAMHDPERDITFWVPVDVDRLRLTGARSSQYQRQWLYFGSHDELSHYIPVAHYFHPPADFRAFHLPLLYGIRRTGENPDALPDYMIQSLLIDPMVTPTTGGSPVRQDE